MTTVKTTRLYTFNVELPREDFAAAYAAGLRPSTHYWLESSRPSSLGGYLGNFRSTYRHSGGTSPGDKYFANIPMRYLVPHDVDCLTD